MKRKLFNLAAMSLVLCVTTAALWVVSVFSPHWIGFTRPAQHAYAFGQDRWRIGIERGFVVFMVGGVEGMDKESEDWLKDIGTSQGYPLGWRTGLGVYRPRFGSLGFAGPRRFSFRDETGGRLRIAEYGNFTVIPFWMVALAASLPFQVAWIRRQVRRLQDSRIGHCQICGYDLRATPDRCPECGATPQAVPRAAA